MHNCLIVKIRVLGRVFHLLLVAIELNVPRELFSSITIELNFVLGGGHGFRNTILFVPHNRNKKKRVFFFLFCFVLFFVVVFIRLHQSMESSFTTGESQRVCFKYSH